MMSEALNWLESQKRKGFDLLKTWVLINSGTENKEGLTTLGKTIAESFQNLRANITFVPLPPWKRWNYQGKPYEVPLGEAIFITKRENLKRKILLGGHMDTVFPPDSPFQSITESNGKWRGPGVADMKGGLVVLWLAISALEKFNLIPNLGFEILITPDEEVGSPGSKHLWEESAKRVNIGLLFEPSFADGFFVDARKGSLSFTLLVKGRAAHVGRDFQAGRSAVKGLCEFITQAYPIVNSDTTLNFAHLYGGDALNIIPPLASCKGNLRSFHKNSLDTSFQQLRELAATVAKKEQLEITLLEDLTKAPKEFNRETEELFHKIQKSGKELGILLEHRPSGGLSDGNILQNAGLPTIDTLGVIGGNLHTQEEFMLIDSLISRAKLTTYFLKQYANQEGT